MGFISEDSKNTTRNTVHSYTSSAVFPIPTGWCTTRLFRICYRVFEYKISWKFNKKNWIGYLATNVSDNDSTSPCLFEELIKSVVLKKTIEVVDQLKKDIIHAFRLMKPNVFLKI